MRRSLRRSRRGGCSGGNVDHIGPKNQYVPVNKMDRNAYTLTKEPRGETYRSLLDAALQFCDTALLVIRNEKSMSKEEASALARLQSFERERQDLSEWPGTVLHGGTALVIKYAYGADCASVLKALAPGLYAWLQPDLPEDLCLFRPGGTLWLGSIAHERDAWFELTEDERRALNALIPDVGTLLEQ